MTLGSSGTYSLNDIQFEGVTGQDCINHSTPTGAITLDVRNCVFNATVSGGLAGLRLDNQGTGFTINALIENTNIQGATVDGVFGEDVTVTCQNLTQFSGGTKSLELSSAATLTNWTGSCSAYVTVENSTLTNLFGGWTMDTGSTAGLVVTGASSVTLAMTQIQPPVGFACIQIGAGATVNAFYCPLICIGATNCIEENGSGDAGSINKSGCCAPGTVSSTNSNLTITDYPAV